MPETANYVPPKYMGELMTPQLGMHVGDQGPEVRRVQEWLCHHGFDIDIDSDFGGATERAVMDFQMENGIGVYDNPSGVVDGSTWSSLCLPLMRATSIIVQSTDKLGEAVVRYANRYMREGAREFGGDNKGQWQRHFSRGRENQPWCQDFASTCWIDAARDTRFPLPFALCENQMPSSYVPWVANSAKAGGKFQVGTNPAKVPGGSMFFVRSNGSYSHVGIVIADYGSSISTIEGNSNNSGSANGYAVVRHYRSRSSVDFGLCV